MWVYNTLQTTQLLLVLEEYHTGNVLCVDNTKTLSYRQRKQIYYLQRTIADQGMLKLLLNQQL